MARQRRFRCAGLSHHVIQRGNNRLNIFRTEEDCELLLTLLRSAAGRYRLEVNGYTVMQTHFHLLVTPQTPTALEKTMHAVNFQYARYFNQQHQRTGALFEGRYRTTIVDTDVYWYACLRYVELNAVRAGIVPDAAAYRWSSYAAHATGTADPLLTCHRLYLALGNTPHEREAAWQTMCGRGLTIDELGRIRDAVHAGGVLGALVAPEDERGLVT